MASGTARGDPFPFRHVADARLAETVTDPLHVPYSLRHRKARAGRSATVFLRVAGLGRMRSLRIRIRASGHVRGRSPDCGERRRGTGRTSAPPRTGRWRRGDLLSGPEGFRDYFERWDRPV